MPLLGKSISLYLMDGTAAGRWQATLSNWNGIAYKVPRGMLKDCFTDLTELRVPGVYFLFGRDDSAWRQFVYIGEGDDALKRLMQPHDFEKDGSYWTEAIAEIKALCAGAPCIKERMELDVDVSRLRIMKAAHQSKQYEMEDNLMKHHRLRRADRGQAFLHPQQLLRVQRSAGADEQDHKPQG